MREVGHDRQDAGPRKAKRGKLLPIELGIAEREIAAADVGAQLAAALPAQLDELVVDADEILGRRDVVVDERHPIGQRIGDPRGARSNREVMEQQVVGTARVQQIAIVVGQILEPRVGRLDEDLRIVAGRAQDALDAEHLVPDGVAVAERRQHLVDGTKAHRRTAPGGTPASTSAAAGRLRARLREEAGQRRHHRMLGLRLPRQAIERLQVLPLDHRPRVVGLEIRAAVPAQRVAERAARRDRVTTLRRTPRSSS